MFAVALFHSGEPQALDAGLPCRCLGEIKTTVAEAAESWRRG